MRFTSHLAPIFAKGKKESSPFGEPLVAEMGFEKSKAGYLLFVGRTRQITQYAATAVADIDPDSTLREALVLRS